jgi:drug/metabolite transporter (DMT)-like permease
VKSFTDLAARLSGDLLLLLAVATLQCTNQLFLKAGVTAGGAIPFSLEGLGMLLRRILTTPLILAGYAVGVLTGLLWLTALSRLEISVASPAVTGLYFILLLFASRFLLSESITPGRWAGVLLILGGILLLARK